VNALTIVPCPTCLHLIGPHRPLVTAVDAMNSLGRMAEVVIDGLIDSGFHRVGWVHPMEPPGGKTLSDRVVNEHGCFLFETPDGPAFYNIHPVMPDDGTHDLSGKLGTALVGLRVALINDDRTSRRRSERLSAHKELLTATVRALVVLSLYLLFGSLVLCTTEGWTALDAVYFCVVTMSTVGYGDLNPTHPGTQTFTTILILFGVIGIFPLLANVLSHMTEPYVRWGRRKVNVWIPNDLSQGCCCFGTARAVSDSGRTDPAKELARQRGSYLGRDGEWREQHALIFYLKNLAPSIVLNVVLQFASAGIFCAVEHFDYGTALYHCFVTASTVGYGSPTLLAHGNINPLASRLWASLHILLSVALLGDAIKTYDKLREERRREMKRIKALNHKLSQSLLDNLNMRAAALRPEVARDAEGVTELEFVVGMCVELGMVDMDQLAPFINKFRELDVDGNGRLGSADLRMQKRVKMNLNAVTELAWSQAVNRQRTKRQQLELETARSTGQVRRASTRKPTMSKWQLSAAQAVTHASVSSPEPEARSELWASKKLRPVKAAARLFQTPSSSLAARCQVARVLPPSPGTDGGTETSTVSSTSLLQRMSASARAAPSLTPAETDMETGQPVRMALAPDERTQVEPLDAAPLALPPKKADAVLTDVGEVPKMTDGDMDMTQVVP